ncbi:MAG: hypothetical protein IT168_05945 [Bryobacterales bacterium]|nr:hypothetical protein [Bryobacterales bacterium]
MPKPLISLLVTLERGEIAIPVCRVGSTSIMASALRHALTNGHIAAPIARHIRETLKTIERPPITAGKRRAIK